MLARDYPLATICRVLDLPRSSWYYTPREATTPGLEAAINQIAAQFPTYGSRRVMHQLRRVAPTPTPVGRRRLRRLIRELGLQPRRKPKTRRTTNSRHPFPRFENLVAGLEVTRPHQVWAADLTYVRIGSGEARLPGDHHGRLHAPDRRLGTPAAASAWGCPSGPWPGHWSGRGAKFIIRTRGCNTPPPITSSDPKEHGVRPSMAAVGRADQNGYAERVIRTIKEEEVALNDYPDLETARQQLGRFIDDVYQAKRIHSSLGYLTPGEFAARWAAAG